MQQKKRFYGCVCSTILLYRKLKGEIEDFGFLLNPYYYCVDNNWFKGSHMTVIWHVHDPKIYHKEVGEVKRWSHTLSIHIWYIDETVDELPEDLITPVESPASENMFNINKGGKIQYTV